MFSYKDDPEKAKEAVRIANENAKKAYKSGKRDFRTHGLDPDRIDRTGLRPQRGWEL
jgi:hypothetical protein